MSSMMKEMTFYKDEMLMQEGKLAVCKSVRTTVPMRM